MQDDFFRKNLKTNLLSTKATYLIIPWFMGLVQDVVFGGKKCKSIDFSTLISRCGGQLSTIKIIFCPCLLNLRSRSRGSFSISFHPSMLFSGLVTDRGDIVHG